MDEFAQAKKVVEEVNQQIEWLKCTYLTEEDRQSLHYFKNLERLYIMRTKAELSLKKIELSRK